MKKTSMSNPVKSLEYIKCHSLTSSRPVKSPSNSIRCNCEKIYSWSRRPKTRLGEEWWAITCMSQYAPKIILGVLLSSTLHLKIACLVLIFNLILVLHVPPKKYFIITHFKTTFLLLSKLVLSLAPSKW